MNSYVFIIASYYPNSFMLCKTLHWQQSPISSLAHRAPNPPPLRAWIQETSTKMLWEKAFPWERSCGDSTDPGHWHEMAEGHWRSLLPGHTWLMAQLHRLSLTFPQTHSCFHSRPSPPQAPQPHHSEGKKESLGSFEGNSLKEPFIYKYEIVLIQIYNSHTFQRIIWKLASLQYSLAGGSQAQVLERKGTPQTVLIPSDHEEVVRSPQRWQNWGFTKWWNKAQGEHLQRGWLVNIVLGLLQQQSQGDGGKTLSHSSVLFKELYKPSPFLSCGLICNFKGLP